MQRLPDFEFNRDKFRLGQRDAFDETVLRIQHRGESHTAIVLPTRYGKSDYMRMTGLYLLHQGAVSGVMVMTLSRVLRNQMVNAEKLAQSLRWYETKLERINSRGTRCSGIFPCNMADRPEIQKMVDSELVATTTSMVSRNLSTIVHWIDHLKSRYGVYPVIFVDEAHTAINQTAWGKTIEALADSHAKILLCTATPTGLTANRYRGFR